VRVFIERDLPGPYLFLLVLCQDAGVVPGGVEGLSVSPGVLVEPVLSGFEWSNTSTHDPASLGDSAVWMLMKSFLHSGFQHWWTLHTRSSFSTDVRQE
jgi:hypothetical protein